MNMNHTTTRGFAPIIIIIGVILILLLLGAFSSRTGSWKFSPPAASTSTK